MADEHIKIGDLTPRVQQTADGSQTEFVYTFPIFKDADLVVYLDDAVQTSGFTISGAGEDNGGTVTFDTAPADGVIVTLLRKITIERTSDYTAGGGIRSKVLNDDLDKIIAILQEFNTALDRKMGLSEYAEDQEVSSDQILAAAVTATEQAELASEERAAAEAAASAAETAATEIAEMDLANADLSNVNSVDLETAFSFSAKGFSDGSTIENSSTDAEHDIKFNPGIRRDADDSCFVRLTSAMTKRIDATWSAGTGNGGLANGTVAASTTYHNFFIKNSTTGAVDCGFDTSPTAANLLAASGYDKYRRVGSFVTNGSGNIPSFLQIGKTFNFAKETVLNDSAAFATIITPVTIALCPAGVRTRPILGFRLRNIAGGTATYIAGFNGDDSAGAFPYIGAQCGLNGGDAYNTFNDLYTNTSSQIHYSTYGISSGLAAILCHGYIDEDI